MAALKKYRAKRDFTKTREPRGGRESRGTRLRYVIQKHAARRLHYDFRLEHEGVLLSWAVPKGPSLDPNVKRLAVEVEPHPIEYATFEGTIPKGEYGGGTVMVWDQGYWVPDGDPAKAFAKGHLSFTLAGEKLRGSWHLVRSGGKDGDKNWLLFKGHDEYANQRGDLLLEEAAKSVVSGLDLDEIASSDGKVWRSNRSSERDTAVSTSNSTKRGSERHRGTTSRAKPTAVRSQAPVPRVPMERRTATARKKETRKSPKLAHGRTIDLSSVEAAKPAAIPDGIGVELATLVESAPAGDDWIHELKFDGYRVLVRVESGRVQVLTRRGNDWTERMPSLARTFRELKVDTAIIDGEFVALDDNGLSDFQALQNQLSLERDESLIYYAFDLLYLDGYDLRACPLTERKRVLKDLLQATNQDFQEKVRYSEHVVGNGPAYFAQACARSLEGIISKRADSLYHSKRTRDWVKVKCLKRQEFVVVGYSQPSGARRFIGALLVAVRRGDSFTYAGRVGTGFTERSLEILHQRLASMRTSKPQLDNPPRGRDAADVQWVRPSLVVEVSFLGFTDEALLRHASFCGIREDKDSSEVVLEDVAEIGGNGRVGVKENLPEPSKLTSGRKTTRGSKSKSGMESRAASKGKSGQVSGAASKGKSGPEPGAASKSKSGQVSESASKGKSGPESRAASSAESQSLAAAIQGLSNPDKVMYPEIGVTKRELLDYYAMVARYILPHVSNRPLTLVRCPNGWDKPCFFQKHPGEGTPPAIHQIPVREKDGKAPYSVIDDEAGLLALVQIGVLEVHTWGSRVADASRPDVLVFDLDPDVGLPFAEVIRCAKEVRKLFEAWGLESFVKTTGGKGLHVCVPVVPDLEWDDAKAFCQRVANEIVKLAPDKYLATQSKAKRKGKIFIDYLRNGRGATFVAPYSTRARTGAPIATPIEWDELTPKLRPDQFNMRNIAKRLDKLEDDPFARMLTLRQRLRT